MKYCTDMAKSYKIVPSSMNMLPAKHIGDNLRKFKH